MIENISSAADLSKNLISVAESRRKNLLATSISEMNKRQLFKLLADCTNLDDQEFIHATSRLQEVLETEGVDEKDRIKIALISCSTDNSQGMLGISFIWMGIKSGNISPQQSQELWITISALSHNEAARNFSAKRIAANNQDCENLDALKHELTKSHHPFISRVSLLQTHLEAINPRPNPQQSIVVDILPPAEL